MSHAFSTLGAAARAAGADHSTFWRTVAGCLLGITLWWVGKPDAAEPELLGALELAREDENSLAAMYTLGYLALIELAAERRAVAFVLGLPLNMDGSEGPRAQSTRAFARNLARLTDLPIGLWDERLSTAAVERELIAADVSRDKRKAVIDEHAAIFILQGALDRLRSLAKS